MSPVPVCMKEPGQQAGVGGTITMPFAGLYTLGLQPPHRDGESEAVPSPGVAAWTHQGPCLKSGEPRSWS